MGRLTANSPLSPLNCGFAHKGEDYSYDIKAQFSETKGTGTRSTGLGIVGRPCTFDFVKQ
jgi:hypothetical protein